MSEQNDATESAMAELQADSDFQKVTPREKNFIANFLGTISGDRFADGANFQADIKSYGYKNVTRLTHIFSKHYPNFHAAVQQGSEATRTSDIAKVPTPLAAPSGDWLGIESAGGVLAVTGRIGTTDVDEKFDTIDALKSWLTSHAGFTADNTLALNAIVAIEDDDFRITLRHVGDHWEGFGEK